MIVKLIYSIGTPPKYSPFPKSKPFSPARGNVYIDENAALLPYYPLEPVFRAVQLLAPSETVRDMDLVTCDTTIEKLLQFVMRKGEEPYRFDVEIVGETAIFTRMEGENVRPASSYSSDRTRLLEKETGWDTRENQSQSHYRISKCTLDDIKCLLRCEGQAYIPKEDQTHLPKGQKTSSQYEAGDKVSHSNSFPRIGRHSPLDVRFGGKEIPQRMMAHINTGDDSKSELISQDVDMLRLWLSNTTTVVTTVEQGFFNVLKFEDFEIRNLHWERAHEFDIVKLASLIRMIIETAKGVPGGKCWVNVAGSLGLFIMAPTRDMGLMSLPADIRELMFGIPR